jgi:predicted DNA-binding transcriptional regulator YafY
VQKACTFAFYTCFCTKEEVKAVSANERQLELIMILEGRRQDTIDNLITELTPKFGKVSIRTIKYDLKVLEAHYPIETIRGHGGGVRLLQGFLLYKGDITQRQQETLIDQIPIMEPEIARTFGELLRAHGSWHNKNRIEEVLKNLPS